MRPTRTVDKYWIGTRNFNHIQYERDLEDYIIDLENEIQQMRKHAVVGQSEQLMSFAEYCNDEHGLFIPSWMVDGYNKSR